MPAKIRLISQWFDPEPTPKGLVFARGLQAAGYTVEVVTGFPNYPGGKLYPGYKLKLIQREVIDGVQITRLPLYPSHDHSALGRAANYATFCLSSMIYGLFFAPKADIIYAYHPPVTVGVSAAIQRLVRRTPVVYDIQDLWPDTLRATGMIQNRRLLTWIDRLCSRVYRSVDQIVVLSNGFKRLLSERGVPLERVEVIENWADENTLRNPLPIDISGFFRPSRFSILFAGNMGKAQALDTVIEAAEILLQEAAAIDFVFVGGGVERTRLEALVKQRSITNVRFLDAVPMSSVGAILAAADCLLVSLKDDPLFEVTIPSKTQAYMCMGKPILMNVAGEAAHLVDRAQAGLVVPDRSAHALSDAARTLSKLPRDTLARLGANGRSYYDQMLSVQTGVERFSRVFEAVIRRYKLKNTGGTTSL